ncbi:MAG: hypothetical protein BGO05_00885 [Rhizobiales bacterium 63-7]|mgnify:CR=1 FL=1|nr:hypothetical protein [Hyphomicrobiales bacterium]OJU71598.1 MAG: hypothetical protein BGO05_00885 [Rhizobiales bacterium 63-7]
MTTMPDRPQPGFFADEMTERVFASVVALAAEVSILRERVAQLEQAQGIAPAGDDPARAAEDFVADVFGHLARPLPQM